MKTTISKTFAILTVSLAASSALACGGGNKGGGYGGGLGGNYGGVGIRVSGGYNNGGYGNNGNCQNGGYANGNGGVYTGGQAYEPFHSTYICQPGDSFYTVSLKEYGTSANQAYIAQFNRLPVSQALVPGQRLVLPSISARKQLSISNRPAGIGDTTPVQGIVTTPTASNFTPSLGSVTSNFASSLKPAATEPALPKVTVGSTLVLDGQVFGDAKGAARLHISGLVLPVEVLEWSTSSAKVRLPQIELTAGTKAEIEVLRADGSVASKSAFELTPAADRLASTN